MTCPHCGRSVTGVYCTNCGAPAPTAPAGQKPFQQFHAPQGQKDPDLKTIPMICIIGAILFGVIFLIGVGISIFSSIAAILPLLSDVLYPWEYYMG